MAHRRSVSILGAASASAALWLGLAAPPPVQAGDPCCSIKKLDLRAAPCCTAQVGATAQTFTFHVPRAVAARLRVGQKVALNAAAKRVTIPGLAGSFEVVGPVPTGQGPSGPGGGLPGDFDGAPLPRGGKGGGSCGLITAGQVYQNHQGMTRTQLSSCCHQIGSNCQLTVIGGIRDPGDPNTQQDDVARSFQCTCH